VLPKALVVQMPARVGLVLDPDMRRFVHEESRWGVDWKVELGPAYEVLAPRVFQAAFADVKIFDDLEAARRADGLKAIFLLKLEQYSFTTQRETGRYFAVTMRYRLNLYSPDAGLVDSYTFTGYGTALAGSMSGNAPLAQATVAAMRDAAAKFLVQFPDQPAGKLLAKNEAVVAEQVAGGTGGVGVRDPIEAVPIEESPPIAATSQTP
jgi:hypothetical protein